MTRMFARHKVEDFSKWKVAYDAFGKERSGMGVTREAVFQDDDNPNDVTVFHDFKNLDSARKFADSPRLKEIMHDAGVKGSPQIWFTEKA